MFTTAGVTRFTTGAKVVVKPTAVRVSSARTEGGGDGATRLCNIVAVSIAPTSTPAHDARKKDRFICFCSFVLYSLLNRRMRFRFGGLECEFPVVRCDLDGLVLSNLARQ